MPSRTGSNPYQARNRQIVRVIVTNHWYIAVYDTLFKQQNNGTLAATE